MKYQIAYARIKGGGARKRTDAYMGGNGKMVMKVHRIP